MDQRELPRFLHRLRFLSHLPVGCIEELAACGTLQTHPTGSILFEEGDEARNLYLVIRGQITLEMHLPDDGEMPVLTLGSGEMLGWSALLGGGRMTVTATTQDETQLVVFPAEWLNNLCRSNPEIGYQFMRQLAWALSRRLISTRLHLFGLLPAEANEPSREDLVDFCV